MLKKKPIISKMTKKEVPVKSGVSKELTSLLNEANKKFGKNSLTLGCPVREDTGENLKEIKRIPTGSFAIDIALGGGIPIGRFSQISGIFSSTKTTQCIHILRETQRMGMLFSFHDAEGTTDDKYLKSLGVDTSKLPYNASGGLEETLQMILDFQKSKLVHGAILDSIEGLVPQAEYDSNMDENTRLGVKATKMNEFFRKYQANNNKLIREGYTPFTLIGINQMRDTMDKYNPTTKPGGRGKEFAASVDMELRKGEWLKVNKEIVGQVVNGVVRKNKTYKRMQEFSFDFYFEDVPDLGIKAGYNDNFKSCIIEGVAWGIIERGGAWYYYNNEKFQGEDKLIAYFRENPRFVGKIREQVLNLVYKIK